MHVPATVTLRALEDVDGMADELAAVASMLDVDSALDAAANAVRQRTGVQVSFLGTTTPDNSTLHLRQASGNRTDELLCLEIPAGTGLGGRVLSDGRLHIVDDYLPAKTITHEHDAAVEAEGLRAIVAVPIEHAGTMHGVLYGAERAAGPISDVMCDAITEIAEHTGLLLDAAARTRGVVEQAVANERSRLASELHDSVGAMLFTIGASATELAAELEGLPEVSSRAQALAERASSARVALRRSLRALNRTPRTVALGTGLSAEVAALRDRAPTLDARLIVLSELPEVPDTTINAVTRAVREALHNAEKHAGARSVVVTVTRSRGGIAVAVADDGRGFGQVPHDGSRDGPSEGPGRNSDAGHDDAGADPTGLGLEQAAVRLGRVGGDLSMLENDEGGVTVRIWTPTS
ncbi:GAF domain-containing sensor histidine kinase [Euzebya tangerina]|uniref:GAF domain-containing sensor histidine kinase n=1 Tax=Euzebya tangerina TaxID=591198 RepID=UPI0013C35D29|nr:GAF domain-containing protein [Euzebya tangerina]